MDASLSLEASDQSTDSSGESLGESSSDFSSDFPSWAPRFYGGSAHYPLLADSQDFRASEHDFRESFHKPICLRRFLRIQGLLLQSVTRVHSMPEDPEDPEDICSFIFQYLTTFLSGATLDPTGMPPLELFSRTLLRNSHTLPSSDFDTCFQFILLLARSRRVSPEDKETPVTERMKRTIADLQGAEPEQTLTN